MTGLLATKPRPWDVPALAEAALWQELELTPKPGLVDKLNNGSHRDMDHALFAAALRRLRRGFRALPRWAMRMRINLWRTAASYPPDGHGLRAGDVYRDERSEHPQRRDFCPGSTVLRRRTCEK
jgi:triphosphoribosyl-dephospho-CoA synthetase